MTAPTPNQPLSPATRSALGREWELFADWCASWEMQPIPATAMMVGDFLAAFPGAASTQALRVRAIRHHHARPGAPLDLPGISWPPSVLWRTGDGDLLDVADAVGQLPRYRFPVGLRGRRNAFVLVAAGIAGLNRDQIHQLTPVDLVGTGDDLTLAGVAIPWGPDSGRCPRCVVARWLMVLGPAWAGDRGTVRDVLDVTKATPEVHECEGPAHASWTGAEHLVVALDTHGWVRPGVGLSTRTISSIIAAHRTPTGFVEAGPAPAPVPLSGRYAGVTGEELYEEQDDVDARVAALLIRSRELLADAEDIDAYLRQHD